MENKSSELLKRHDELVAVLTAAVAVCMETTADQFVITGIKTVPSNRGQQSAWAKNGLKNLMANRL